MKLTISAGVQSVTVDLPDSECKRQFRKAVDLLIPDEVATIKPKAEVRDTPQEKRIAPPLHVDENPVPAHTSVVRDKPLRYPPFTGFLYLKCASCGEVRGFSAKVGISSYHCQNCKSDTDLSSGLIPMFVSCECGRRFKYLTNFTDPMFDIPCLNCESPVAITYNAKAGVYETIGRERRRKHGPV